MKIRIWIIILMFIIIFPQEVKGDIAPYQSVGCSSKGIFIDQENITMLSFFVNVTVDLPLVTESYTYYLQNIGNSTIDIEAIIPLFFEKEDTKYYEPDSIEIYVNDDLSINYSSNTLTFREVYFDDVPFPNNTQYYTGVTINLSFKPNETLEIQLKCVSTHAKYTSSFHYFYTAKTAKYWNGSIKMGYFQFEYLSEMENISYNVPNGTLNDRKLVSVMHEWDGNADYEIQVNTGIHKGNYISIWLYIGVGIILFFILGVILFLKYVKWYEMKRKDDKQQ